MTKTPTFAVSSGLLEPGHVAAIGPALWEFLLLVDWQTSAAGSVLAGRPIRYEEIAARLGHSLSTVRTNILRLRKAGYVTAKRSREGLVFTILNPKKRFRRVSENSHSRSSESQHSEAPDRQNPDGLECQKADARSSESQHSRYISTSKDIQTTELFNAFWKSYPRKVAKPAARTAFERVVLKGKPPHGATLEDFDGLTTADSRLERLTANTAAWAIDFAKRPSEKVPHPATYINRLDWVSAPQSGNGAAPRLRRAWE